jgi:two-component system phosphate regulon response regulator PhoB
MPENPAILVIEDEEPIQELIRYNLEKEGFAVSVESSGERGLSTAVFRPPDLIVLDLMLPGLDGLSVCRELKRDPKTRAIPVIMVTAKGEESDIVTGLTLGADDYLVKPFSPKVLLARIRSVLRRRAAPPPEGEKTLEFEGLRIHPGRREVTADGRPVALTFSEFEALRYLARRPGWVFTRSQIVDAVRGEDAAVTDRAVDVLIVGLRRKLGVSGKLIETVRGIGYRFKDE